MQQNSYVMEIDPNDLILDDEPIKIDKEYYIAALCDKFPYNDMDETMYFNALDKAIDKTLEDYTKDGKLLVEDWDMFEQDLYSNSFWALNKRGIEIPDVW